MKRITRRKFMRSLAGAGLLALLPGCAGGLFSPHYDLKISAKFLDTKRKLEQQGFVIDDFRYYDNNGILIFRPDNHSSEGTKNQLFNLKEINEAVNPDVYFLESLSGELTYKKRDEIEKAKTKRMKGLENLTLEDFFMSRRPTDFWDALRNRKCYGIEDESFKEVALIDEATMAILRRLMCTELLKNHTKMILNPLTPGFDEGSSLENIKLDLKRNNLQGKFYQECLELAEQQEEIIRYLVKYGIKSPGLDEYNAFRKKVVDERSRIAARFCNKTLRPEEIGVLVYGLGHRDSLIKELKILRQNYLALKYEKGVG